MSDESDIAQMLESCVHWRIKGDNGRDIVLVRSSDFYIFSGREGAAQLGWQVAADPALRVAVARHFSACTAGPHLISACPDDRLVEAAVSAIKAELLQGKVVIVRRVQPEQAGDHADPSASQGGSTPCEDNAALHEPTERPGVPNDPSVQG